MILRGFLAAGLVAGLATTTAAWPLSLVERLNRDARRLVPLTLRELLAEREKEILAEAQRFPPDVAQTLALDLVDGRLDGGSVEIFNARADEVAALVRDRRVSDGLVKLGALVRIPADLADPVLSAGPDGYPPGVTREYYAFIEANLEKIPVVLDSRAALRLERKGLPAYWQGVLDRSRDHSPVIRTELFRGGRVVDHHTVDFRSPVFGVASLSYSRAVTAIAATWLAVWREVRGDVTRMPAPEEVVPKETP